MRVGGRGKKKYSTCKDTAQLKGVWDLSNTHQHCGEAGVWAIECHIHCIFAEMGALAAAVAALRHGCHCCRF
jgi:hypothetical protein